MKNKIQHTKTKDFIGGNNTNTVFSKAANTMSTNGTARAYTTRFLNTLYIILVTFWLFKYFQYLASIAVSSSSIPVKDLAFYTQTGLILKSYIPNCVTFELRFFWYWWEYENLVKLRWSANSIVHHQGPDLERSTQQFTDRFAALLPHGSNTLARTGTNAGGCQFLINGRNQLEKLPGKFNKVDGISAIFSRRT